MTISVAFSALLLVGLSSAAAMHDETERLILKLQDVRLSDEERARIRTHLTSLMREHPVAVPAHTLFMRRLNAWFTIQHRYAPVAVAGLFIALTVGGGTSYAALSSLPGDALYPFKVGVIEPLSGVLAITPEAQAIRNAQLASQRLTEAEDLAAEGRLTPASSAILTRQLQSVTQAFDKSVYDLQNDDRPVAALDAKTTMAATLQAHRHVLAAVSPPEDQAAVQPILALVEDRARSTAQADAVLSDPLIDTGSLALVQQKAAEEAADSMQSLASDTRQTLDDQVSKKVMEKSREVAERVDEGDQNMRRGDYAKAMSAFQSAIVSAKDTNIRVDAIRRFNWKSSAFTDGSSTAATSSAAASATSAPAVATLTATSDATTTPQIAAHQHKKKNDTHRFVPHLDMLFNSDNAQ